VDVGVPVFEFISKSAYQIKKKYKKKEVSDKERKKEKRGGGKRRPQVKKTD